MKNKCKVLAVIMAAVMCFAMAGCGSDKDVKKTAKPEKPKMTSVVGEWECTGAEIEDNGEKVSDETLKTMLGEEFSEMLHITAYSDGKRTLYKSGGNAYISYNDFAHCLDGKPIGYSYAASK